jgi:hypothetical protein
MTLCEFLKNRRRAEYPTFEKVLKALPVENWNYRPHEKSASAAEIVWMLARESHACSELIDNGVVNWLAQPTPTDPERILSAFREQYASLDDRIDRIGDAAWQKEHGFCWKASFTGKCPLASSYGTFSSTRSTIAVN